MTRIIYSSIAVAAFATCTLTSTAQNLGTWDSTFPEWQQFPIHAIQLHTGKLLF